MLETVASVWAQGEVFVIDSMPLPVCHRVPPSPLSQSPGPRVLRLLSSQKGEVLLICTPEGVPVSFTLLPAAFHDLTAIHELTVVLPSGASVFGDKGYISEPDAATILAHTGVRLVSIRRRNMEPNSWDDEMDLKRHRKTIETVNTSDSLPAPTSGLRSKFRLLSSPSPVLILTSNQGIIIAIGAS